MVRFISKYGLSTHLALLASAPLALTPFFDSASVFGVVLWLSLLALIWVFVEPSLRKGENHVSVARLRVRRGIIRDPFFWFMCFVLLVALFRCLNNGITMKFEPEQAQWIISESRLGGGPSCVQDAGLLPLGCAVAMTIVAVGIRHALGLMARTLFGIVGAFIAGIGALVAIGFACSGIAPEVNWLTAGFADNPFWSSIFGVWLIVSISCSVHGETRHWVFARVALVFSVAGNLGALVFFSPPIVAVAWIALVVITFAFSLAYLARADSLGGVARISACTLSGAFIPFALLAAFAGEKVVETKLSGFDSAVMFPEAYTQASAVLTKICREVWTSNPWFGSGIGSFELHAPFLVDKADWVLLPVQPKFAHNGYWMILAERGIFGCIIPVVGFAVLIVTYALRAVGGFIAVRGNDESDIFPFAVSPVAWCAPLTILPLAAEAYASPIFTCDALFITVLSAFSIAAAAFPKPKAKPVATEDTATENSPENN